MTDKKMHVMHRAATTTPILFIIATFRMKSQLCDVVLGGGGGADESRWGNERR